MRDSDTWMAIFDEGRLDEAKRLIIQLGTKRLGPPDEATSKALGAIEDLDRLESLGCIRILDVTSWQELLAAP